MGGGNYTSLPAELQPIHTCDTSLVHVKDLPHHGDWFGNEGNLRTLAIGIQSCSAHFSNTCRIAMSSFARSAAVRPNASVACTGQPASVTSQ